MNPRTSLSTNARMKSFSLGIGNDWFCSLMRPVMSSMATPWLAAHMRKGAVTTSTSTRSLPSSLPRSNVRCITCVDHDAISRSDSESASKSTASPPKSSA